VDTKPGDAEVVRARLAIFDPQAKGDDRVEPSSYLLLYGR
jgi:hypothetical protein